MTLSLLSRRKSMRFPPWQPLFLLLPLLLLLTGCMLQPIVAGEAQQQPGVPGQPVPVLAVAPTGGPAGTQVTVSSAGWQAGEAVSLEIAAIQGGTAVTTTITTVAADADGRINSSFFMPLDVEKSDLPEIAIIASSLTTNAEAVASFTVIKAPAAATVSPTVPPTPTSTPLPLASATATAVPTVPATVRDLARVTSGGLNVRSGPAANYAIVRTLSRGNEMIVIGQNSNGEWLYVRLPDGLIGWVARDYTDFTGSAPVVQPPPPPPAAPTATPTPTAAPVINDWRGEYYDNRSLLNSPVLVRNDVNLDFDWGTGAPASGLPSDGFAVRWTRTLNFDSANYRFNVLTDDGARVWLDGNLIIDQWRDGSATTYSAERYLGSGSHSLRIEYYENSGAARLRFWWERVGSSGSSYPDWKGEYWDNRDLDDDPVVVRNDDEIRFNWGNGSPDDRVSSDNFSVRWTQEIDFDRGLYRFYARADDGIRVWIDDDRVIDEWHDNLYDNTYTVDRVLDDDHDLRVEYFEHRGGARVRFWWERLGDQPTATPTPTTAPSTATPTATATATATPIPPTATPTATPNANAKVSPAAGGVGTRLTVSGSGFPANTPVRAYLGGLVESASAAAAPQPLASTTTDGKGAYTLSFVLPDKWPDGATIEPGQLVIVVATDNFTVQASGLFEYRQPQPTVAPRPYANVEPQAGGAGTTVAVSGGGFPASTTVNVHLAGVAGASAAAADAQRYATTTTDANGNYNVSFALPDRWPDGAPLTSGKLIVLVATSDFGTRASADFDYFVAAPNPSIRLNPTSGGATTQVTASGGGFPANVPINLHLGALGEQIGAGNPRSFANGRTDGNGNYSLTFTVPAQWPNGAPVDTDKLLVLVATEDFSVQVSATFNYALPPPTATPVATDTPTATPTPLPVPPTATPLPAVNVAPSSGGANQSVTVSGSGFPASSPVNIHLARFDSSGSPDATNLATATTDGNGNFAVSFVMPAQWPNGEAIATGQILVVAATNDFGVQASAGFNYVAPAAAEAPPTEPITGTTP